MGTIARMTVNVANSILFYEGEIQDVQSYWRIFDLKLGMPVDIRKEDVLQIVWKCGQPSVKPKILKTANEPWSAQGDSDGFRQ